MINEVCTEKTRRMSIREFRAAGKAVGRGMGKLFK